MTAKKFLDFILVLGTTLLMLGTLLFFKEGEIPLMSQNHHSGYVAQNTNTYLGPTRKVNGNPQLVRIQILVYNDPNPKGDTLIQASFDGTDIPLKPRDIYGYRGQASFQKSPGTYKLKWEVERGGKSWPRKVSHEEEVTLDPRDLWIQITITGENAEIS